VARCARIGFIIVGQTKNSLSKKGENGKEKPTDLRGQRRFFVVADKGGVNESGGRDRSNNCRWEDLQECWWDEWEDKTRTTVTRGSETSCGEICTNLTLLIWF
jgi:hypothetical protein